MKLVFAKALINDAPILFLDEPTITLDVPSAHELRAIVKDLNRRGKTILYTTHQMTEAEELCHRVAIIDKGEIIALGTVEELKATIHREGVIKIEGVIPSEAYEAVRLLSGVKEAALTKEKDLAKLIVVGSEPRTLLPSLIRTLFENGATIEYISPAEVTLEDVFVAKTGRTLDIDTRIK